MFHLESYALLRCFAEQVYRDPGGAAALRGRGGTQLLPQHDPDDLRPERDALPLQTEPMSQPADSVRAHHCFVFTVLRVACQL